MPKALHHSQPATAAIYSKGNEDDHQTQRRVVTFSEDIREDDAESLINAIRQLRGVQDVSAIPADVNDFVIRARARAEYRDLVYELLRKMGV